MTVPVSKVSAAGNPRRSGRFRDPLHTIAFAVPGIIAAAWCQPPPEIVVQPDAFRVTSEPPLLVSELRGALAVCLFDDTQAVGGLLHLRYVATNGNEPLDLTDNTLSSDLLLMDRFCKELRSAGARKQSWRVSIFGHTPQLPAMEGPAATVIDLAKAYFADARLPVECKEFSRSARRRGPPGPARGPHLGERHAGHGRDPPGRPGARLSALRMSG